jgi:hypothetical protein
MSRLIEEEDREGEIVRTCSIKVSHYLTHSPKKGLAMIGQLAPHYYFDRPLSVLFGEAFAAGFAIDGLLEPAFSPEDEGGRVIDWMQFQEIPPVLTARLRVLPPRT